MSNQVYANQQDKYYELPGLNNYIMSADQTVLVASADIVSYNTVSLEQRTGLLTFVNGVCTIESPGIYCIAATVGMQPLDDSKDPSYELFIRINRSYQPLVDINVGRIQTRAPNIGGVGTTNTFLDTTSFTGYLGIGDTVQVIYLNRSSDSITLLSSSSDCLVTKIY